MPSPLVAALLALPLLSLAQEPPDDPSAPLRIRPMMVTARAHAFSDGVMRTGAWTSVDVQLANGGPSTRVRVSVSTQGFDAMDALSFERWVELPSGTIKRVALPFLPRESRSKRALTIEPGYGPPMLTELELFPALDADVTLGVLGDDPMGLLALGQTWEGAVYGTTAIEDDPRNVVVGLIPLSSLPDQPWSYEALDGVIWPDADPSRVLPEQLDALTRWVATGGHLTLTVSDTWAAVASSPLAEVLPVSLSAPTDRSLNRLYGIIEPRRASWGVVTPVAGATVRQVPGRDTFVFASADDAPLWVVGTYGLGTVTVLTASPSVAPLSQDREALWRALLWLPPPDAPDEPPALKRLTIPERRRLHSALLAHVRPHPDEDASAWDDTLATLSAMPGVAPLPLPWLLLIAALYLLLIGPVDYMVLKRLNRQPWTWVTFPLFIALFTTVALVGTAKYKGSQAVAIRLDGVDVLPGTTLWRGSSDLGVFTSRKVELDLRGAGPEDVLLPLRDGGYMTSPVVSTFDGGAQLSYHGETWTLAYLRRQWVAPAPGGLTASLDGDQLTLTSTLPVDLDRASVYHGDGQWQFSDLRAGQSATATRGALQEGEHASSRYEPLPFEPSRTAPTGPWQLVARTNAPLRDLHLAGLAPESTTTSTLRAILTVDEPTATSGDQP